MHGIIVADKEGMPLTPYISWRDGRSIAKDANGISTFDRLVNEKDAFFSQSGMKLRGGLPIISLAHLVAQKILPNNLRLFTLTDWLLWCGGERNPSIHVSLAAGTGLFDIHRMTWSSSLFNVAGIAKRNIQVAAIAPTGKPIGSIELGGRRISVFGGVGDLQAAVFGAGLPYQANLAINLGTGSQVLRACNKIPAIIERRPGLDGRDLGAITHIPSGRALNVFADFFDGCASLGRGETFFWRVFERLSSEEILNASLKVNMNVFTSAWKYEQGGSILFIHEGNLSPNEMLAAIAKGWLSQYVSAMDQLDPEHVDLTFLLSGGLSRHVGFVSTVLETLSGRTVQLNSSVTGEETLDGLLTLAQNSGHVN
jgi:sugar (pentulose or hexulose) kinase